MDIARRIKEVQREEAAFRAVRDQCAEFFELIQTHLRAFFVTGLPDIFERVMNHRDLAGFTVTGSRCDSPAFEVRLPEKTEEVVHEEVIASFLLGKRTLCDFAIPAARLTSRLYAFPACVIYLGKRRLDDLSVRWRYTETRGGVVPYQMVFAHPASRVVLPLYVYYPTRRLFGSGDEYVVLGHFWESPKENQVIADAIAGGFTGKRVRPDFIPQVL